jgi:hypothetical protein
VTTLSGGRPGHPRPELLGVKVYEESQASCGNEEKCRASEPAEPAYKFYVRPPGQAQGSRNIIQPLPHLTYIKHYTQEDQGHPDAQRTEKNKQER